MIGPPRFYRKDVTADVTASMFRGANSIARPGCYELGTEAVTIDVVAGSMPSVRQRRTMLVGVAI